jgi:putative transposase
VLDGILFRMRNGCMWHGVPHERFPSKSTCHRWMQRWATNGTFRDAWAAVTKMADELGEVSWIFQCIDASFAKCSKSNEGVGRNPTDRGKGGVKKSVLTDRLGYPLSVVQIGANRHDTMVLEQTVAGIIIPRPVMIQHMCLDKAYTHCTERVLNMGYFPHIRKIGEEKQTVYHTPRRWVVERCHAWFNNYRGLRIRYERKVQNHQGMLDFACCLMWYRRIEQVTSPQTGPAQIRVVRRG